jgi:hypothetical protein
VKIRKKDEKLPRDSKGRLRKYTDLGCYPIFYVTKECNVLCTKCASAEELHPTDDIVVAADVNYEDSDMHCDACGDRIESAYAED